MFEYRSGCYCVQFTIFAGYTSISTKLQAVYSMSVTIYHNPRCSKSRQTLALLRDKGFEPEVIEYLKTPPGKKELQDMLEKLGLSPRELMRKNEAVYKDKQLDDESLSDDQLMDAMIEHPVLIERPIVLANNKAAIGRPPESVLDIL